MENRKQYYYKVDNWGGFYRSSGTGCPEEYIFKTHEWKETDDALEAFC